MNIKMIVFYFIFNLNSLIYSEYIRIYTNMVLKIIFVDSCAVLHRWTAAHCHALPADTAMRSVVKCAAAWIRMPHTAHSILHNTHSRTPTWFKTILCECICIDMNFRKITCLIRIHMNQNNTLFECMWNKRYYCCITSSGAAKQFLIYVDD
jgi:hypothetical protein